MRTPVIAGNWKMNKTVAEAVALASEIKEKVAGVENVKIIVCPVFTAVKSVADVLKGTNVKVGAQDMYWETSGAYTGEVSGEMLLEAGAEYVIIEQGDRARAAYYNYYTFKRWGDSASYDLCIDATKLGDDEERVVDLIKYYLQQRHLI